jgi:hypothetical protein
MRYHWNKEMRQVRYKKKSRVIAYRDFGKRAAADCVSALLVSVVRYRTCTCDEPSRSANAPTTSLMTGIHHCTCTVGRKFDFIAVSSYSVHTHDAAQNEMHELMMKALVN